MPNNNFLELYIKTKNAKKFLPMSVPSSKKTKQSIFSFKNLKIINKNHPLIIDHSIQINSPVNTAMAKEKINIIVGKARKI